MIQIMAFQISDGLLAQDRDENFAHSLDPTRFEVVLQFSIIAVLSGMLLHASQHYIRNQNSVLYFDNHHKIIFKNRSRSEHYFFFNI